MKSYVLGMIGIGIILYMILCFVSIYSISTRKNELDNCASDVIRHVLEQYYGDGSVPQDKMVQIVEDEIQKRLNSSSKIDVEIIAMDLVKGLFFVEIRESFYLPNGFYKELKVRRNAIMEEV